ncbi:MAG: DoxX family protein [Betaproteobacteria bacterium]|nr:DoxX family protein [Betaproteobacteria bacterium]
MPKQALRTLLAALDWTGNWLPRLLLRGVLAYEFWQSGVEKLHGSNWFTEVHTQFPFPLNFVPVEISWHLATWAELIGPAALILGLGTRITAVSLSLLTLVAIAAVHAGSGYNVCEEGWKLPFLYLVMFLPLILSGPGPVSVDHWLRSRHLRPRGLFHS